MTIDDMLTAALDGSFRAASPVIAQFLELLQSKGRSSIRETFTRVMHPTISFDADHAMLLYDVYYIFQWVELLNTLHFPENGILLEIASGSGTILPEALTQLQKPGSHYVTFNENTQLTDQFRQHTASVPIPISIIEDSGAAISKYFPDNTGDVVAFHHGLNDIIQAILAAQHGIDTINENWWTILPDMIALAMEAFEHKTLKSLVIDDVLALFEVAYNYVKPEGYLIFNNHLFAMDIELGYSPERYGSFIPLFREWVADVTLPFREITIPGYSGQWWLILQKM